MIVSGTEFHSLSNEKKLSLYLLWPKSYPIYNETAIYYGGPDTQLDSTRRALSN